MCFFSFFGFGEKIVCLNYEHTYVYYENNMQNEMPIEIKSK